MLYTILQIIAFQALFLLVYDLFLKRETFFNYNRAYLLITALLSLILPFIKFPELKKMTANDVVIQLPEVFIGTKAPTEYEVLVAEQAGIVLEQPQMPIWQTILLTGVCLALVLFLFKITKLYWLKYSNPKRWKGNVLIVKLIKSSAAFSFFNTIFLGEQISETAKPTIYKHELVHIKEFHTLDLLFFELLRIIFWFNPLVYIYQNRIKTLHEYIADAKAVKQSGKTDYYQSLLNQVFDVNNVSFTNTFFKKSLIKKRIVMLQKTKSNQLNLIKYTLIIPMILGMLIYSSTEVRAQKKIEAQEMVVNQELTDDELIEKYYNEIIILSKDEKGNYNNIFDKYDYSNRKFIPTKDEYLRYVAHIRYLGISFKEYSEKSKKLTKKQQDRYEEMISFNRSYDEHLEYLKTEEAKQVKAESNYNRTLQVISENIDKLTDEEHKDAYEKVVDVLSGRLYKKLIIRDKNEAVEITKNNYDAIVHFFSTDEIKALMTYVEVNKTQQVQELIEVPFSKVDEVPTLVECKDLLTNQERKNCMNQFVNKHVNKNFNTKIADSLSPGRKHIFVQFKINSEGKISDIKARGPSVELEEEAKRVVSTLPQFVPGKQKGELVTVPYSLPIVFQVVGNNTEKKMKSYNELVAQRDRVLQNSSEKNPVVINLNKQIDSLNKETLTKNKKKLVKYLKDELNNVQKDTTETEKISFSKVEVIPVHPNCESISKGEEQKKCTVSTVSKHVNKNFNTSLAESLDLPSGKNRIFAQFIIDKQGKVTQIKAKGPHPKLEEEVTRVLKLLPQFRPGKQDGEAVEVAFSLPIVFQIAESKKN